MSHSETSKSSRSERQVVEVRQAGEDHQVLTVKGSKGSYRRSPCSDCPWRVDATGEFPAEAFRHSARTAVDLSESMFACHQAGAEKPMVCAGFLLRGADHNLAVRLGYIKGRFKNDISNNDIELHPSYRAMAVANGVDPDDPALKDCRD